MLTAYDEAVLKAYNYDLEKMPVNYRNNTETVIQAVLKDQKNFAFIGPDVNMFELADSVLHEHPDYYQYLPDRAKNLSEEQTIDMISRAPHMYAYLPDDYKGDIELIESALMHDTSAHSVMEDILNSPEARQTLFQHLNIIIDAVQFNPAVYAVLPENMQRTVELVHIITHRKTEHPENLDVANAVIPGEYFNTLSTEELTAYINEQGEHLPAINYKSAYENNNEKYDGGEGLIYYIKDRNDLSVDLCAKIIKEAPFNIKYVPASMWQDKEATEKIMDAFMYHAEKGDTQDINKNGIEWLESIYYMNDTERRTNKKEIAARFNDIPKALFNNEKVMLALAEKPGRVDDILMDMSSELSHNVPFNIKLLELIDMKDLDDDFIFSHFNEAVKVSPEFELAFLKNAREINLDKYMPMEDRLPDGHMPFDSFSQDRMFMRKALLSDVEFVKQAAPYLSVEMLREVTHYEFSDQKDVLKELAKNPLFYACLEEHKEDYKNIGSVSEETKRDPEIVLAAMKSYDPSVPHLGHLNNRVNLGMLASEVRKNPDILRFIAKKNPKSIGFADPEVLKENPDIISTVLNHRCLTYLPVEVADDPNVIKENIAKNPSEFKEIATSHDALGVKIADSKEYALVAIQADTENIKYVSEENKKDYVLAMTAVNLNGYAIQDLPKEYKESQEFQMAAVKNDGLALQFISAEYRGKEVSYAAIRNNGLALQFVYPHDQTYRMAVTAVQQDKDAIRFVADKVFDEAGKSLDDLIRDAGITDKNVINDMEEAYYHKENMKAMVVNNPEILKYADYDMIENLEIMDAAVRKDGLVLGYMGYEMQNNTILASWAVRQNPMALKYVSDEVLYGNWGHDMILHAVQKNGLAVESVPKDIIIDDFKYHGGHIVDEAVRNNKEAFNLLPLDDRNSNLEGDILLYARDSIRDMEELQEHDEPADSNNHEEHSGNDGEIGDDGAR